MKYAYAYAIAISLALFGAGCFSSSPTSLIPRPTSTEQNATTVDQNQSAPGTGSWLQYRNYNYGFDFKYPANAVETFRSDAATGTVLFLDLGPTVASSTALSVPNDALDVKIITNDGTDLQVGAELKDGCYDERDGSAQATPGVIYNGQQVCVVEGAGAAAGNRYNQYWYTIPLGKKSLVFAFTIHSVNCQNFDKPGACLAFDESRDSLVSKMIMSTLNTFTPSKSKENLNLRFETKSIKEDAKDHSVDVKYPVMFGGDAAVRDVINGAINTYISTTTQTFARLLKTEGKASPGPFVLQNNYSIYNVSSNVVSIVFNGYEYTGGAHGISIVETFVFDTSTGKRLTFDDIFKSDSDYLKIVSDYAIAELSKKPDMDVEGLKSGAAPDLKNYQYYYLNQDGLVIIFPEYQVAPYAAGPQVVTVPYASLKDMMKLETEN
ncbi:MAG: DUF3298 and DUF4163 domain-containing protein [Patescibacteria group bacterium]|nr:DUF3298 and DUF4163 domain-containing protein [Patescibacteria group bacterium]